LARPLRQEEVEEQNRQIEETQKEMRQIRALESTIMWNLEREEKKQVEEEKREAAVDIMEWREQLACGLKEADEERSRQKLVQDLYASKEFQEFKRDAKQVLKEADIQHIKEQYQADVEHSQMQAELAKHAVMDRHATVLENLEGIEVLREVKENERVRTKKEQEQERARDQRLNFNHKHKQLRDEKQDLLRNLQQLRSLQKQPIETSGRAGRPREKNGR
jgi:hypothetical protein